MNFCDLWFFHLPCSYPKAVSNSALNLPSYLNLNFILHSALHIEQNQSFSKLERVLSLDYICRPWKVQFVHTQFCA
jgi:hypothetical protein